jgi:hypothetical protein
MGDLLGVTVTPVQPHAATKEYLCPGCDLPIPPGTFHLVVVPDYEADLRRHWHRGCWHKEMRRRLGAVRRRAAEDPTR